MAIIDWGSSESAILFNPRLPIEEQERLKKVVGQESRCAAHLWLSTSGSSGPAKWAALSKMAFLASARAVNSHLQVSPSDSWITALPEYHVGGLAIWARAYLLGIEVVTLQGRWNPHAFCQLADSQRATLSSLVPTQVYDIVQAALPAPTSLRAVVVGGGALTESYYHRARSLGWPLLPSYGLTEAASQVATAELQQQPGLFPRLKILPHLQVTINAAGLVCIKGESLLTGYATITQQGILLTDPKKEGLLLTEDRGCLDGGYLELFGRGENFVKIGGESVDLTYLEGVLKELQEGLKIFHDFALIAYPDERLGHRLHLLTTPHKAIDSWVEAYHQRVLPFARIAQVHRVESLPRSPLGKLLRSEALSLIKQELP
jgi:O-succinylbenzoic acid--CoA ligase